VCVLFSASTAPLLTLDAVGGFTTSVEVIKQNLSTLYASGGGDGPEAVTAALKAACDLEWRQSATRLAVLIADAPPHGIGEVSLCVFACEKPC
jgi:hypothetical protein